MAAMHAADCIRPTALAHADEHWCQTRASFALSGIELTDDDAERAGRLLAGVNSLEEVYAEIRCEAGVRSEG